MKFDIHSTEAKAYRMWAEREIESARSALERDQDEYKTHKLRARIKALRDVMGLPERINNGSERFD